MQSASLGQSKVINCMLYVRWGEEGKVEVRLEKNGWLSHDGAQRPTDDGLSEWNSEDVVNSKNGGCEQEYLPSC